MEQEDVDQPDRRRVDAERKERIDVQAAHLDVLDAVSAQRGERALPGIGHPLGPDGAVELVLDLQQRRGELAIVVAVAQADRLVGRIGLGERALEAPRVAAEVVEAHRERRLRLALVAERAHAQRRREGRVHRAALPGQQPVRAPRDERAAGRGSAAQQQDQQPRVAPEIADEAQVAAVAIERQRNVLLAGAAQQRPRLVGQREVVVDARDRLHAPAVPVREAVAVRGLEPPRVGSAVARDGDVVVVRQPAGHARAPQQLVAQVPIDHLVQLGELEQALVHVGVRRRDQLELRLAEVGRDARVGERRAQPRGMRRPGERPVGAHAQSFLLDAAQQPLQHRRRQRLQPLSHGFQAHLPVRGDAHRSRERERVQGGGAFPPLSSAAIARSFSCQISRSHACTRTA